MIDLKSLIAGALIAAASTMATCGVARAQAIDLFRTAPAADRAAAKAEAPEAGAVRERLADLNPAAFTDKSSDAASPLPVKGRKLKITLFPGVSATFRVTSVEPDGDGAVVVQAESGRGEATFVVSDGKVTGRVLLKGRTYRIRPAGGLLHKIAELSRKRLPPDGPQVRPDLPKSDAPKSDSAAVAPAATGAVTYIDVLYAYTTRAKTASPNIRDEIGLATAVSNVAFKNSQALIRFRAIGSIEVNFDETSADYGAALDAITGSGPYAVAFKPVRTRRERIGADLVVLLREGGEYCGIGWVNVPPAGASAYGYSVSSRGCIEYDVVAHETGHNMGLNHDRYVSGAAGDDVYNYGYVNLPARVLDIMAYTNRCDDAGVWCEPYRAFSNATLRVKNQAFGIPQGRAGAADATRWLNEVRGSVAAFRTPPAAGAPATDAAAAAPER